MSRDGNCRCFFERYSHQNQSPAECRMKSSRGPAWCGNKRTGQAETHHQDRLFETETQTERSQYQPVRKNHRKPLHRCPEDHYHKLFSVRQNTKSPQQLSQETRSCTTDSAVV